MHTMNEHLNHVMYGYPDNTISNIPKCNCHSINYVDYTKPYRSTIDDRLISNISMDRSKIKMTNNPREIYNTGNIYTIIDGKAYIPATMTIRTGFREQLEFEFSVTVDPMYAIENTMLEIKDVIFNPPATIVFWGDGSKTVVKCQHGEEYDPEKGLTMAFFKRMHDNKGRYFNEIKKWRNKYIMSLFKDEVHKMTDETIMNAVDAGMSKSHNHTKWVVFYARADRNEDEGYVRYPIVYKHKSSAVRAAKKLISKLPANVEYDWFVDYIT